MKSLIDSVTILYEDNDVLAVNKPAGLIVHGDGKTKDQTLVDWILRERPEIIGVGEPRKATDGSVIQRPGIVHRIDRETSGVLLVAKNQDSFEFLKSKFKNREMKKVYLAYVHGTPKDPRGIIERVIRRSKNDFRKWTSYIGRGLSRPAVTHFRVLKSTNGIGYIELRPKTGRTHQLRVHMSSIGHPIIGDILYGPGREKKLGFDRVALHASSIEYINQSGQKISVTAPLTKDFQEAGKMMEDVAK